MIQTMQVTEWWNQSTGTYIGAFGGAGMGVVIGCLGAAIGVLAPKGKCKTLLFSIAITVTAIAVILLIIGTTALCMGQPRHVWYGPMLAGFIGSAVMGSMFPVFVTRFRQAETRRFDAEALKRS